MNKPNQVIPIKLRILIPFMLFILLLPSLACDLLLKDYGTPAYDVATNPPNPLNQSVETYYGTGEADTTYEYSNVPSVKTNVCHDTLTEAVVKIYNDGPVPANAGFTHTMAAAEVYFAAEIHAALSHPWLNQKCVYFEDKSQYRLVQINGILNVSQGEMTPYYTSETICPNAAIFVKRALEIELTYDCKKGPTTFHYHILLERQVPQAIATP